MHDRKGDSVTFNDVVLYLKKEIYLFHVALASFIHPALIVIMLLSICLVGEAARRPVGNLYKLDGRVATSYAGKKDRDKEERMRQGGGVAGGVAKQGAQGQATGVAGQLNKNVLVSADGLFFSN